MPLRILRLARIFGVCLILFVTVSIIYLSNSISLAKSQTSPKPTDQEDAESTALDPLEDINPGFQNNDYNSHLIHAVPAPAEAILTLFTTLRSSAVKATIHKNTITNWSLLKPHVVPLVFADEGDLNENLKEWLISHGWSVASIPKKSPGGLPVLRFMYMKAIHLFNTTFYSFANSDLLFDNSLIDTLKMAVLPYSDQLNGLMLVGRRTNVKMKRDRLITTLEEVRRFASRGSIFGVNAQDYFLTTRDGFPWKSIPDFVIGRSGYDNWLVAKAMLDGLTTIDATETVLAFHQSGHDGDFAWKKHKSERDINVKIAGPKIFFQIGHTDCTPFRTAKCPVFEANHSTIKPTTDSCPAPIILTKQVLDHCYRLKKKFKFKATKLINFKQRMIL